MKKKVESSLMELGFKEKIIKYWGKEMNGFDHPNFPFPEDYQTEHHGIVIGEERLSYFTIEEGDIISFLEEADVLSVVKALEDCGYPINQCIDDNTRDKIMTISSRKDEFALEAHQKEDGTYDPLERIRNKFSPIVGYFQILDILDTPDNSKREELKTIMESSLPIIRQSIHDIDKILKEPQNNPSFPKS